MASEKHAAAFQDWMNANTALPLEAVVAPYEALREAFQAGWDARKQAQFALIAEDYRAAVDKLRKYTREGTTDQFLAYLIKEQTLADVLKKEAV